MRYLARGLTVLAPLLLGACNLLNQPPEELLKRCMIVPYGGTFNAPLSVLVDTLTERKAVVSWQHDDGRWVLRAVLHDLLGKANHEFAVAFDEVDGPTRSHCGSGAVQVTGAMFDGEEQNSASAGGLVLRVIEAPVRALQEADAATNAAATAAAHGTTSNQSQGAAEISDEEAIEDDRQYYARQTDTALKQRIHVVQDGTSYCCLTLGDIVRKYEKIYKNVRVSPSDDGTVQLTFDMEGDGGVGTMPITYGFKPAHVGGRLMLDYMATEDHGYAMSDGSGLGSTDVRLINEFGLRPESPTR